MCRPGLDYVGSSTSHNPIGLHDLLLGQCSAYSLWAQNLWISYHSSEVRRYNLFAYTRWYRFGAHPLGPWSANNAQCKLGHGTRAMTSSDLAYIWQRAAYGRAPLAGWPWSAQSVNLQTALLLCGKPRLLRGRQPTQLLAPEEAMDRGTLVPCSPVDVHPSFGRTFFL
jgi:hypothetical protein